MNLLPGATSLDMSDGMAIAGLCRFLAEGRHPYNALRRIISGSASCFAAEISLIEQGMDADDPPTELDVKEREMMRAVCQFMRECCPGAGPVEGVI